MSHLGERLSSSFLFCLGPPDLHYTAAGSRKGLLGQTLSLSLSWTPGMPAAGAPRLSLVPAPTVQLSSCLQPLRITRESGAGAGVLRCREPLCPISRWRQAGA